MKAYLINMHLLVPRSRSSDKVKVIYKGYISQEMAISGTFVFHKHILFIYSSNTYLIQTSLSDKFKKSAAVYYNVVYWMEIFLSIKSMLC